MRFCSTLAQQKWWMWQTSTGGLTLNGNVKPLFESAPGKWTIFTPKRFQLPSFWLLNNSFLLGCSASYSRLHAGCFPSSWPGWNLTFSDLRDIEQPNLAPSLTGQTITEVKENRFGIERHRLGLYFAEALIWSRHCTCSWSWPTSRMAPSLRRPIRNRLIWSTLEEPSRCVCPSLPSQLWMQQRYSAPLGG